jgi:hypothetical protein
MSNKLYKIKKARTNIKLLEDADHLAISKIDDPKYKKILSEQERQLNHYLAQYKNPDYLPDRIATEYEFPRYFYYTVNSKKNGITPKRTRTDSLMFKKFMKNKTKRDMAYAQGVFKILDAPIKMNIDMAPAYPKKPKTDFKSILGNVSFDSISDNRPPPPRRKKLDYQDPQYEYTGKPIQYIKEDIGSNLEYELDKKIEEVNKKLEKQLLRLKTKKKPYKEFGSIQKYDVPKYNDEKTIDQKLEEVNKKLKSKLFNLKYKLSDKRYKEVQQKMKEYKDSIALLDKLESENKPVKIFDRNRVINELISNLKPYVPPNVKLDRNIEDIISRRQKIDDAIQKLSLETNDKKINSLIKDISNMTFTYNFIYDLASEAWDPNWVKKEMYLD